MIPGVRIPAIVPAAGESRRMGRPKLLLEFEGEPLIGRVVKALREGGAELVIVVAPPDHAPEGPPVAEAAGTAGARVIVPGIRPVDMRASVELGLAELALHGPPPAIILTPADAPALDANVVARVIDAWRAKPESVVIACSAGMHAHPTAIPWDLAAMIPALPENRGVDQLFREHADRVVELEVDRPGLADEFNTLGDLNRWQDVVAQRVRVRLFAVARECAGQSQIEVLLPPSPLVADLRKAIGEQYPTLKGLAAKVMIAVDSDFADDDHTIPSGAELALIPPVSGG